MICETCGRCTGIKINDATYEIQCLEKGGFKLHKDYEDNFNCGDYVKAEPKSTPPKENVLIVLSGSGRDFMVYDETVKGKDDITKRILEGWDGDASCYVSFGEMMFCASDIACYGYIGE